MIRPLRQVYRKGAGHGLVRLGFALAWLSNRCIKAGQVLLILHTTHAPTDRS